MAPRRFSSWLVWAALLVPVAYLSGADPAPAPNLAPALRPSATGGSAAFADPPKITGDEKWAPYSLVRLTASGLQPNDAVLWKIRPLDPANEGKVAITSAGRASPTVEWVAPPGRYRAEVIIGRGGPGGTFALDGDERIVTIGDAAPVPPGPTPPPGPNPKPPGPVPVPVPDADPVLVAKLAPLVKDADRDHVANLGKVYYTTGVLLGTIKDPAARPKTFRDVLANLTNASALADVPRLPALTDLRTAVAAELGNYDAMAPVTDALAAELAAKYKRMGASLQAAAVKK